MRYRKGKIRREMVKGAGMVPDTLLNSILKMEVFMEEEAILQEIEKTLNIFNFNNVKTNAKKFSGAITTEVIRQHLMNHNFSVSNRDVFIHGIKNEVDLLIAKPSAKPKYGILYEPKDVLAVLEIKKLGSFGQKTIVTVQNLFNSIKEIAPHALCCYLTVLERHNFRQSVNPENLGYPAYTLFNYKGDNIHKRHSTTQWNDFIKRLNKIYK